MRGARSAVMFVACLALVVSPLWATEYSAYQLVRPASFSRIFYSEIVSVEVQDNSGRTVSTYDVTDGGYLPQSVAALDELNSRNPDPRTKIFSHANCFSGDGAAPPALALDSDQYLVVKLRWRIARHIVDSLRFPAHVHVDSPFGWPWSTHNEVLPTGVWQHAESTCPQSVGNPEIMKNKCVNSLYFTGSGDKTTPGQWSQVFCPGTKVEEGGSSSSVRANLGPFMTYRYMRDEQELASMWELGIPTGAPASFSLQSVDAVRIGKKLPSYAGDVNLQVVGGSRELIEEMEGDIQASQCPAGERWCGGDADNCLHCTTDECPDIVVRIRGSKLKTMNDIEQDSTNGVRRLGSIGFVIHDAHGEGGDTMGMAHMMEPYTSLYVPINLDGNGVADPAASCPAMEKDSNTRERVRGEARRNWLKLVDNAILFQDARDFVGPTTNIHNGLSDFIDDLTQGGYLKSIEGRVMKGITRAILQSVPLVGKTTLQQAVRRMGWRQIAAFLNEYVSAEDRAWLFRRECSGHGGWVECLAARIPGPIEELYKGNMGRELRSLKVMQGAGRLETACKAHMDSGNHLWSRIQCDTFHTNTGDTRTEQAFTTGPPDQFIALAVETQIESLRQAADLFPEVVSDEPVVKEPVPRDRTAAVVGGRPASEWVGRDVTVRMDTTKEHPVSGRYSLPAKGHLDYRVKGIYHADPTTGDALDQSEGGEPWVKVGYRNRDKKDVEWSFPADHIHSIREKNM